MGKDLFAVSFFAGVDLGTEFRNSGQADIRIARKLTVVVKLPPRYCVYTVKLVLVEGFSDTKCCYLKEGTVNKVKQMNEDDSRVRKLFA